MKTNLGHLEAAAGIVGLMKSVLALQHQAIPPHLHLNELNPYWDDYLINTRSLRISYLNKLEAEHLIRQPVADFPNIYTEKAIQEIIRLTRCQPYFVQLICFELVEFLNQQQKKKATSDDVNAIIPKVLEVGGNTFRERLRALAKPTQRFLIDHVEQSEPITVAGDQLPTVRRLIRKEILEAVGDRYQFQVPLFKIFVAQCAREGW